MEKNCSKILTANKNYRIKRIAPAGLELILKGIYTEENVLYFHFSLSNRTSLDYGMNAIRWTVEDRHQAKRNATQVLDVYPLLIYAYPSNIKARTTSHFVVALPGKTLRPSQRLIMHIMEINGARLLSILIKPRMLIHAKPL